MKDDEQGAQPQPMPPPPLVGPASPRRSRSPLPCSLKAWHHRVAADGPPLDQVTLARRLAPSTAGACRRRSRGWRALAALHRPVELAGHVVVSACSFPSAVARCPGRSPRCRRASDGAPVVGLTRLQPSWNRPGTRSRACGCTAGTRSSRSARRGRRLGAPCGAGSPPPASARPAAGRRCRAGSAAAPARPAARGASSPPMPCDRSIRLLQAAAGDALACRPAAPRRARRSSGRRTGAPSPRSLSARRPVSCRSSSAPRGRATRAGGVLP
jgi:hypothetical protein